MKGTHSNGMHTGKAQPSSTCSGAKARPDTTLAGRLKGDRGNFMGGANSGKAKPCSSGKK